MENQEYLNKQKALEYTGWSKSTLARYLQRILKRYLLNCFDPPQDIQEKTQSIRKRIIGKTKHNKVIFVWDYLKSDLPEKTIKKKEDTPRDTPEVSSEDTPRDTSKTDEGGSKTGEDTPKIEQAVLIENATLKRDVEHLKQNIQNREQAVLNEKAEKKEAQQKLHSSLVQLGIEKGRADGLENQIKLLTAPKRRWWQK